MSDSSSSSSSTPKLDSVLANQPVPAANVSDSATATSSAPTASSTPAAPVTTTTVATEPKTAIVSPLREDMIKPAVSFLSSPNVRSADKAKKIAFLQKKGLNQAEIDEAFKRSGSQDTNATTTATTTTTTSNTTPANNYTPQNTTNTALAPVLPSRNAVNYGPPQIVYLPEPPAPSIPVEKVFAMAVLLGMGAVGLTAGVVGILRRFIAPIFNRIADYQRNRYNQHKEIADKLAKSIKSFNTENDDLDALIDQGEEKTVSDALIKQQTELSTKIDRLMAASRERVSTVLKQKTYTDFRTELTSFRNVITNGDNPFSNYSSYSNYNRHQNDSPAVAGLKSDIRSFKAVLLNRRNFPTAK